MRKAIIGLKQSKKCKKCTDGRLQIYLEVGYGWRFIVGKIIQENRFVQTGAIANAVVSVVAVVDVFFCCRNISLEVAVTR